ncbi:CopG family ribbon-helix-helix protein [Sulfoacidibacillus thermotolerans]|uniref:Antitoxin n=1 Tax=Sulfoacidibacillus thermotolerans TaxID=1765684 RepID=A0A2U3D6Q7_SULT2|nr:ribbon-helix-helix protein, CopG family [Sulfoacidibacillus thermotolerans]PWI56966.1 antitoxin [Sulfoacidibacillus thermotolerans]
MNGSVGSKGDLALSRSRRIAISMPPYLLDEVDVLVAEERNTRSDLIRKATAMYLRERKKQRIRELLQQGYQEMAVINLRLASEAFEAEAEAERIAQRLVSGV